MGFFSWDCKGCGRSARSPFSTTERSRWMSEVVAVRSGSVVRGVYDGYGRINGPVGATELTLGPPEPTLWHSKCFDAAGGPLDRGPSKPSYDQGFFIEDGDDPSFDEVSC